MDVNLYDGHYGLLDADPLAAVRRETYGEDIGQAGWLTVPEAREWFRGLELGPGQTALEVACGTGGFTCLLARETGAACVGVDVNEQGIEGAVRRARDEGLADRVEFRIVDAGQRLPFADGSFDVVFCNDSINHLPGRLQVLRDWLRVLRPGGRVLYSDPIVVTGQLTGDEMRARSSIGYFLFTPLGANERFLAEAGFQVRRVWDGTPAVEAISRRWREGRAARREAIEALEGGAGFAGVQDFLAAVNTLAGERRLSRYIYLAYRTRGNVTT